MAIARRSWVRTSSETRFGWYLERAAAGEDIRVTRRGRPYVRLSADAETNAARPSVTLDSARALVRDRLENAC